MSKKQMIRRRGLSAFLAVAMCFGLLPATAWAAEEGVAIDESNFPNKTFRNYIQKVFDKDNNDFFSADEIPNLRSSGRLLRTIFCLHSFMRMTM